MAKILTGKTGKPTYVGCSIVFGVATVEEEIAGMKAAVECIMTELGGNIIRPQVNGT